MADDMDGRPVAPLEGEVLERGGERAVAVTEVAPLEVDSTVIGTIERATIDIQITTAKKYPRSIEAFKRQIQTWACHDQATAESCTYALPRKKDGKNVTIDGPSIRFAEILLSGWGNCRVATRRTAITNEDIEATAVFHDLETNVAISKSVRRRIVGSRGNRYSLDMIEVTTNAAASIAMRNAILAVVPKAIWGPIHEEAKRVAKGDAKTLPQRIKAMFSAAEGLGIQALDVFNMMGIKGEADITVDTLYDINAYLTAIRDGDTTLDELLAAKDDAPTRGIDQAFTSRGRAPTPKKAEAKPAPEKPKDPEPQPEAQKGPAAAPQGPEPQQAAPEAQQTAPEVRRPPAEYPQADDGMQDFEPFNVFASQAGEAKTWGGLAKVIEAFESGDAWAAADADLRRNARALAYNIAQQLKDRPEPKEDPLMFLLWLPQAEPHRIGATVSQLVRAPAYLALDDAAKDRLMEIVEEATG